jgi:hypothetical protein
LLCVPYPQDQTVLLPSPECLSAAGGSDTADACAQTAAHDFCRDPARSADRATAFVLGNGGTYNASVSGLPFDSITCAVLPE